MTPGERFRQWVDETAQAWNERFKNWMASWLSFGFDVFFKVVAKSAAPKFKPIIERMEATGEVPPELQPLLDEIKEPTGEVGAILANSASSALIGGAIGRILDSLLLPIAYSMNAATRLVMLSHGDYINALFRGALNEKDVEHNLSLMGLGNDAIRILKALAIVRLDPMSWIIAYRRGYKNWDAIKDDLKHQGWDDNRIEALKFVTEFMPSPQDLVNWQAKEVFEPAMIAKYGLDDEFSGLDLTLFEKIGVTEEQALNFWRAHWEHASWNQVVEMVRRGQMTEADVWDWFRLVEIPPFWRQKLINISWAVPTRVDVRRFYDMKTIDEARLRELYTAQGYHGKDLDDYVLWTKIYVELPDLLARWKNGWITLDDVRSRLIADGMNADAADELIQTKVKSVEPTSTAEGKELTKAEIYKGVKQGILTYDEGLELLIDLDYTFDQAEYLLTTNVAVLAGSPETLPEFKDMTQKYRKAAGLESKAVPYELQQAAIELVRATKERDRIKESVDQERAKLIPGEILPESATVRLKELEVALHRAESEVARIKQHYEAQLAEYKHGG
jgi:hypothetical protein